MTERRTLVMDIEVFEHYFLVMFKAVDSRKVMAFEMFDGQPLGRASILAILWEFRVVTFNGANFDMPLLTAALQDRDNAQLKTIANTIIEQRMRAWQTEIAFELQRLDAKRIDHIDLMEAVPGVMVSLKMYGARMHSKRLQDMPVAHDAVITPDQHADVRRYCENDLDTTIDLWLKATDPKDNIIATRETLSAEFGIDMRSKSDAQIAEAMLKISVERRTQRAVVRPTITPGTTYVYEPPKFLRFTHPELQSMFADVCAAEFVVQASGKVDLPSALKRAITLGRTSYNMGIGGLHSTEQSQGVVASRDVLLRDRDVVSYYPSLILQCGLFPANMGANFQHVYQDFFNRRMAAKASGNKSVAQTLKIVLNGTFGKLGSAYSVLYSPNLMIQVTVTGQLSILMLIERMEAVGIPVVSANTDGIVMACPAHLESVMQTIVKQWERDTGLETEETRYRALFSRDVNSYVALKEGGGFKTKGDLSVSGLAKTPDFDIIGMAVCALLDKGTPLAETILGCNDIRRFVRARTANGGCKWKDQYLGRVARWYRSTQSNTYIEYVKNGNKVAESDSAMPLMDLPETFPADVDYTYYLREANRLLKNIGAAK